MKTISEVKEILGVERRTLQEYDAIGLLHPSNKADIENGKDNGKLVKWLYDDEALLKLEIISVFREIGYKRSEIKVIIDNPSVELAVEFKKGKQKLLEKKERIEAMVSFFDVYIFISSIPTYFFEYLETESGKLKRKRMDINTILGLGRSFLVDGKGQLNEETAPVIELLILLSIMPNMKDKSPVSNEVQKYIDMVLKHYLGTYVDRNEQVNQEQRDAIIEDMLRDKEIQNEFLFKDIDITINEKLFIELVDNEFGTGSSSFVKDAFEFYKKNKGD